MGLNQNHILSMQTCPKLEVLYMAVSMCVQGCAYAVCLCAHVCMKLYVYIGMCLASVVGERKNHQENGVGIRKGTKVFM